MEPVFKPIWIESEFENSTNRYVAFRATFKLVYDAEVRLFHCGIDSYRVWVDEAFCTEGPARFKPENPEYIESTFPLKAGCHVIAVCLHAEGVDTRLAKVLPPFFACELQVNDSVIELDWRSKELQGARHLDRRINQTLGWIEWIDTRAFKEDWKAKEFDDAGWKCAATQTYPINSYTRAEIGEVQQVLLGVEPIATGQLTSMSLQDHDPVASFFLRRLEPSDIPADGYWFRYDLGKVKLGRVRLSVDLNPGDVVQIGYAESLHGGRVHPFMNSSAGSLSANMDHYHARGGKQVIEPHKPKGGRFIEIHVITPKPSIAVDAEFVERVYYGGASEGSFSCNDSLLNSIWEVGVETLRSCSEDAITDNPTRERGQWLGDAIGPAMDILAVSYADHRPLVRGIEQAAQCISSEGLIPAVFPGPRVYIPTFSLQWIAAIPHYFDLTGDVDLLKRLFSAAQRNIDYFQPQVTEEGLHIYPDHWNFVDWGYCGAASHFSPEKDQSRFDWAFNLFYQKALLAMVRWARLVGDELAVETYEEMLEALVARLKRKQDDLFRDNNDAWEALGYHACVLLMGNAMIPEHQVGACVHWVKQHIMCSFPYAEGAPRLANVKVEETQIVTPFFMHHVMPVLVNQGEMDFVLDVIRKKWGWALKKGYTTWPEVFDERWSHCHQWSGCPTWLLSRYVLGLHPKFTETHYRFDVCLEKGNLKEASGLIPIPGTGFKVAVSWKKRSDEKVDYRIKTDTPIVLCFRVKAEVIVEKEYQSVLL